MFSPTVPQKLACDIALILPLSILRSRDESSDLVQALLSTSIESIFSLGLMNEAITPRGSTGLRMFGSCSEDTTSLIIVEKEKLAMNQERVWPLIRDFNVWVKVTLLQPG